MSEAADAAGVNRATYQALRAELSAAYEIIHAHNAHWNAIADAIGTEGGFGGVDVEPLTPMSNAASVVKRVKALKDACLKHEGHEHCVTPCDSIRIQQENHTAWMEATTLLQDFSEGFDGNTGACGWAPEEIKTWLGEIARVIRPWDHPKGHCADCQEPKKCDGNHAAPACANQECWHKEN
jgi:hypothetical protein